MKPQQKEETATISQTKEDTHQQTEKIQRIKRYFNKFIMFFSNSLDRIQAVANQPVQHMGDDDKITVVGDLDSAASAQAIQVYGIPDYSPFCTRVEAYLRLMRQPYVKLPTHTMRENPRHKIPFCNVYGEMVDDSSRILETLQRKLGHNDNVSDKLTAQQKALGHLIRTVLMDGYYFVVHYNLFLTQSGRDYFKEWIFRDGRIPSFMRFFWPLIASMIYGKEYRNLYGQGYGRYPQEFVLQKGIDDLEALSTILGDQKFILGTDKPTIYDTDVYAFLSGTFYGPLAEAGPLADRIKSIRKTSPNLVEHTKRMRQILYPKAKVSSD